MPSAREQLGAIEAKGFEDLAVCRSRDWACVGFVDFGVTGSVLDG